MRRKATKQSRAANAYEKRLIKWVKIQSCCVCGNHPAHTEVDHIFGSTCKYNKEMIGHLLIIPLCRSCHEEKTIKGRQRFNECAQVSIMSKWKIMIERYGEPLPELAAAAIYEFCKQWDWIDGRENDSA